MKSGKLNQKEFNKRCHEVFFSQEGDYYYSIEVKDSKVSINMEEETADGNTVIFDYEPDMTERPEALAYLMGERDNFND